MVQRANNPRVFAETISIDAWRTPFDGKTAEADLHIDAGFSKGRVGGPGAPIRFRLSLKRAEIQDPAVICYEGAVPSGGGDEICRIAAKHRRRS